MHKVFVYGSLLSGMGNHTLLEFSGAKKVGDFTIKTGFSLMDLGPFPGAIDGAGKLIGEVYEVDDNTLAKLNRLEGYIEKNPKDGLYDRREIDTEFGKAFIYIYNNNYGRTNARLVEDGDWRTHYNNKFKRVL